MEFVRNANEQRKLELLAYCMMSNHAHFAIYSEKIEGLTKLMYEVNAKYARLYNKEKNRCGVLFRNRYQIQPINSERQLINCINYIHQNPVKANMVSKCEDYEYSSYNGYKLNTGLAKSKILCEIFGTNCVFLEMFKKESEKLFMDIEEKMETAIIAGTMEFTDEYKIQPQEIFMDKKNIRQ